MLINIIYTAVKQQAGELLSLHSFTQLQAISDDTDSGKKTPNPNINLHTQCFVRGPLSTAISMTIQSCFQ